MLLCFSAFGDAPAAAPAANEARAGSVSPKKKKCNEREAKIVLGGHSRGTVLSREVKADYGARKTYDFPDVVRICRSIEKGEMKLALNKPTHPKHDLEAHNVPFGTIRDWLEDDAVACKRRWGKKGEAGVPHWRAETERRRRTELRVPGGFMGTGKPALWRRQRT